MVQRRGFNETVTRFWSFAAPAYDTQVLQRWVYEPAQDEVLAELRAHDSLTIADIGCGTGIFADRIQRELGAVVTGVDMSEGMLAQAKARSSNVTWLTAPAEDLPFNDGALDAVVTTSAFHFFDHPAALREFHRVLKPGGIAAVTTFSARRELPLHTLTSHLLNPAHGPSPSAMRTLFEGAGFTVSEQHRVKRPAVLTLIVSDLLTVGTK
ncbi:class I SAM-dependent methyltransferase [Mycolicibacterium llatzerense]|uniref:class I SAM-dependent methyltransferase n=1 Tax=Mycolicibacterium llatzerense TaxID=280871 RepID=UPI0008DE9AFF|nr:class I SAM-dependent methyltransferase [Mycolicibacterium llatzerense]